MLVTWEDEIIQLHKWIDKLQQFQGKDLFEDW
jgi:hypothetical protein